MPDNPVMRAAGVPDDRDGALRYLARTAHPTQYDATHPTLGLPAATHALLAAFYDRGCAVLDRLTELGAWELEAVPYPDYYADLPEDLAPIGRVVQPRFPDGWRRGIDPTGGQLLSDALVRVAVEHGADVRTGAEVVHLVRDDDGRVIGVEARVGVRTAIFLARRGVVFGSGGFIHDRELARAHLRGPVLGGAASESATGDFVRIGIEAGARLGNMSHAWWDQVAVEHAVTVPSTIKDVYSPYGDSMLMVDKYGKRVVNEKAVYNERGQVHFAWDPSRYEYPNLLLFWIFDQAVVDDPRVSRFRWPVPMPGEPFPDFVFRGDTLDELATELRRRVAGLAPHTGGFTVDDGFVQQLVLTIERFGDVGRGRCRRRLPAGRVADRAHVGGRAAAGSVEPDDGAAVAHRPVLLRDPRRRCARHEGRPGDRRARPRHRRRRRTDPWALRRRELHRITRGPGLLGPRRHHRPRHRVRRHRRRASGRSGVRYISNTRHERRNASDDGSRCV